ncbi:MAG TPA: helix-turn-helix transcriptional regulator [Chthoniobacterales bacterium]|nr:helix-turn-helix transcriptional regulator [Chthoniobacterales bacterium]
MAPPKRRAGNGHCACVPTSVEPSPAHPLTPREHEVVGWIVEGKRNGDIAAILQVSARTVEKHVQNIRGKLGVENRTFALRSGEAFPLTIISKRQDLRH